MTKEDRTPRISGRQALATVAKFWHKNLHVGCSGIVHVTKQVKQATAKSVGQALVMVPNIQDTNLQTACSIHVYVTKEDKAAGMSGRQALAMVADIWRMCRRVRCSGIVYVTQASSVTPNK